MFDLLQQLGVSEDASWSDIKAAYRDQLKVWHPDRFINDERLRPRAEEQTKAITAAYGELSKRREQLEAAGIFNAEQPLLRQWRILTQGCGNMAAGAYRQESFAKWGVYAADMVSAAQTGASSAWKTVNVGASAAWQQMHYHAAHLLLRSKERERNQRRWLRRLTLGILWGTSLVAVGFVRLGGQQEPEPEALRRAAPPIIVLAPPQSTEPAVEERPETGGFVALEGGLDGLYAKSRRELSPIFDAVSSCDTHRVRGLLRKGASVRETNHTGQSLLSLAAQRNCIAVTRLLIKHGADLNHRSSNGFTPYDWARWYRNEKVADVLQKAGAHVPTG